LRTAVADVDGDGIRDTVCVTGPGTPIRFAVVSGKDNSTVLVAPTAPFAGSESFTGGGFVAVADIDRDGRSEIVVTPDQGGGPRVTIFSLLPAGLSGRANFFGIDDPAFRGGVRAALGDVNADGIPDLAVCAGFLGGPRAALFSGTSLLGTPARLVGDFFAFPGEDATRLRNGVFVTVGDLTGDGFAELVFGGGPGGAPRVFALSGAMISAGNVAGAQASPVANFFVAGNSTDRGGVRVATKDADGDSKADLVVGSGEGSPARVRVYLGKNFAGASEPGTVQDLGVFGGAVLTGGVYVG
ncbi:MAG TPA: FG-GAP-like repeat-containing protein, partial [Gemmataceae bacterium]|nr:FG-GAP-like repeat-containing protein [Gemmataceae bacterium]